MHRFDPGPVKQPFLGLARDYPGADVYPPALFRVEWGPIFHRGRLDGSARVLVIGQDPGQHEAIARRCMAGEAGQRVQGFLRKLGITRSYVIVNALLYSVYGQPSAGELEPLEQRIGAYRAKWLDALLLDTKVRAVVSFGDVAHRAFERWLGPASSPRVEVEHRPLLHPTYPEGSKSPGAMKRMLDQWNEAIPPLRAAITDPDAAPDMSPYGDELSPSDRSAIPEEDLPAGTPPWMRSLRQWASRQALTNPGASEEEEAEAKRATIVVKIPPAERPWHEA